MCYADPNFQSIQQTNRQVLSGTHNINGVPLTPSPSPSGPAAPTKARIDGTKADADLERFIRVTTRQQTGGVTLG